MSPVPGQVTVGVTLVILAGLGVAMAGLAAALNGGRRLRHLLAQIDRLDRALAALADADVEPARLPLIAEVPGPLMGIERHLRVIVAGADTDRRRVNLLERAVRVVPEGLVLTDEHGTILFRNDVAAEFAGARHGDALVDGAVRELVTEAVRDGHSGTRTLDLFGPPKRTMVVSARPVLAAGEPVGGLAVIADITERRRLDAIRRDFVANISHELKTPVGALSLLAETIVSEEDPQVTRRLAERMVSEATRLANTIEDLLALSRIEAEERPEQEVVRIAGVVAEAATRIRPAATNAGIVLDVIEPDEQLVVHGDRRQLVSALYNLLDNAVKYSDAGSEVTVRVTNDDRDVRITVEDHGIGIPAKDIERVFERFYRVDVARSRQTGGTGLGLSIVRHVMANHGGEVTLDSRLGEGSTFVLRLPMADTVPTPTPLSIPDEPRHVEDQR